MRIVKFALGAATVLLLSGGAYAQDSQSLKPCTPAQQAERGGTKGAPPDSQVATDEAERGGTKGAPPDSQLATMSNCQ